MDREKAVTLSSIRTLTQHFDKQTRETLPGWNYYQVLLLTVHCQAGQEFAELFHSGLSIFFIFFNSLNKEIKSKVITPGRQQQAERAANVLDQNYLKV